MTNYTASYRPKYLKGEALAQAEAEQAKAQAALLAEPHPSTVSLTHFMLRNMNEDVAAGRCTVTCAHRLFASAPRLNVTQVRYLPGNMPAYIIVTEGNREWQTYMGLEQLAVTWTPASESTSDDSAKSPTISGMDDQTPSINIANIFQVIAAVAADNLMRNSIVQTAPNQYRVEIVDGLGNALSEPVYVGSSYAAVQKAGIWFRSYKFGEWAEAHGGSMGDGWGVAEFFSRARTWERNQRNS